MQSKSEMKTMWKETLILAIITVLSGLILGFVHELTKEPIREQEEWAIQNACMAVFPGETGLNFVMTDHVPSILLREELKEKGVTIGAIYLARRGEETIGYVIESTTSEGYGGDIVLYVGITTEGTLNAVSILSISETPGLGMQAEKVLLPQLRNKEATEIRFVKGGSSSEEEIDAISGATITTKAVTNAVNGALKTALEMRGGEEDE